MKSMRKRRGDSYRAKGALTSDKHMPRVVKKSLLYFIPVALLTIFTISFIYRSEVEHDRALTLERESLSLQQQSKMFSRILGNVTDDLLTLAAENELRAFLAEAGQGRMPEQLRAMEAELVTFVRQHHEYQQIRLLGNNGMELVRVNSTDGSPTVVPQSQLQDKSHRYYVKDTLKLEDSRIYISPVDLNVEHGKIEEPYRPMFRFGIPVPGSGEVRQGILVVNYNFRQLIASIAALSATVHARLLMVNSNGYWLSGMESRDEWGFVIPERAQRTIGRQFPQLAEQVMHKDSGQMELESGLFTYTTIFPGEVMPRIGQAPPYWKMISFVPHDVLYGQTEGQIRRLSLVGLILIAIWAFVSLIIAYERVRHEEDRQRIAEQDARIREIVNSAFDGIIAIDEAGEIDAVNPAACRIFGYSEHELTGRSMRVLMPAVEHGGEQDIFADSDAGFRDSDVIARPRELTGRRRDGSTFTMEICIGAKEISGRWMYTGIVRDITERKELEKKLEQMATTDALTGVYNRGFFNRRLEDEYQRSQRYKQPLSLILMDIDLFKSINDSFGHPAGDAYLTALAATIRSVARKIDVVARYGGEEFAIIMPQTGRSDAMVVAERLRGTIEATVLELEGHTMSRTASIGIASLQGGDSNSSDEFLKQADQALYVAKQGGRNQVVMAQAVDTV